VVSLRVPRVSTVMDLSRDGLATPERPVNSLRAKSCRTGLSYAYLAALCKAAETAQSVNEDVRQRHALGTVSNRSS
jgi:hypothetical protein